MPTATAGNGIASELQTLARDAKSRRAGNVHHVAKQVDQNIVQLNRAMSAMQDWTRVLALGIDYSRYTRFQRAHTDGVP